MMDPREFRNTLGRFATGVTVVTMWDGLEAHGITVNSFMSVSLEPPLVAVSIDRAAHANEVMRRVDRFGVSVLRHDQEAVSDHFAGRPVTVPDTLETEGGLPLVRNALARIWCRTAETFEVGDHTIFIGLVERLAYAEGSPLLYHRGRYAHLRDLDLT